MIDPELADALRVAKDASPELSEAGIIREALREWFAKRGVRVKKAERTRPARRKRS
jgi:hypothetical protein